MSGRGLLTSRALPLLVHNHLRDEGSSNPLNDQASVCYDLGSGAADATIIVTSCRLRGRRHAGSGSWPGSRPRGARERSIVGGRQRVGMGSIMRWSVWRGWSAGRRGLRLPLGLVGLRRLRGWVARGVDGVFFDSVASWGDGWVMRGPGCLDTGLGCEGAGLFGRGWGLLLGASADHVWTGPPGPTLRVLGSYCKID